jgi:hypothetical protein
MPIRASKRYGQRSPGATTSSPRKSGAFFERSPPSPGAARWRRRRRWPAPISIRFRRSSRRACCASRTSTTGCWRRSGSSPAKGWMMTERPTRSLAAMRAFYREALEENHSGIRGPRRGEDLRWFDREADNLRAMLDHLSEAEHDEAARAAHLLTRFWVPRAGYAEAQRRLRALLALDLAPDSRGPALTSLAEVEEWLGHIDAAEAAAREAALLGESSGQAQELADALRSLAWVAFLRGEREEAVTIGERAVDVAASVDEQRRVVALHDLGAFQSSAGRTEEARRTPAQRGRQRTCHRRREPRNRRRRESRTPRSLRSRFRVRVPRLSLRPCEQANHRPALDAGRAPGPGLGCARTRSTARGTGGVRRGRARPSISLSTPRSLRLTTSRARSLVSPSQPRPLTRDSLPASGSRRSVWTKLASSRSP